MEFKLNKLTLVLLSAPLIANASITHNGSEYNLLPSNLATNITDNQEHTINGPLSIGEGAQTTPTGEAKGEMTIDNGSKLNSTDAVYIGNQNNDGFRGKLTVTGAGSELNVGGVLNIGNYSNANLSIFEGGKVTSTFHGNPNAPHFWGWFLHDGAERTAIDTRILISGEGSELSYHKDSLIRVVGGAHRNTTLELGIASGGKLSAGVLQLEKGTAIIQIGYQSKGGTLDVRRFVIGSADVHFTFNQNDTFNFTSIMHTHPSLAESHVNFVQSGTGTTLFAPISMRGVNSKIAIADGILKVGRNNAFGNDSVTTNVNISPNGALALNNFNASVSTINNIGTLDLTSDNADKTLTVRGDYSTKGKLTYDEYGLPTFREKEDGEGKLLVKTIWNNANSSSDMLDIKGTATGNTVVSTLTGFIEGDVLRQANRDIYSADVVKVADANHSGTFTGTAKTTNAGEAQLAKKDANTYAWTLKALDQNIYIEPATAYIQMPRVNMELGYSVLDTLHQRRGEISQSPNSAVWARVSGKRLETEGRTRLDVDSSQYVAQVGYDFNRSEMQNGLPQSLSGVYFAYSRADSRFYDQYRAENGVVAADKYTGKGKTTAANIGVYHLYRAVNDAYVDTVAQFSYLTNKYNPNLSREVRQHGWSGAVSVEGGHSFALGNSNWRLEPQTQLVYQHLKLQSFHDGVRDVAQGSDNNLRGRIGVRLSHSKDFQRNPNVYFVANVWHDFVKAKSVLIGDTKYGENYSRTWLEGGAGLNVPFGNHAIHADLRLEHSLGNKGNRSGAKAVLGYSYAW
ncbi:autotransporter outer membrane beta-barrel domain-containing protein [Aggregatibacter segnis]|uniref:autotransporter outer membrane beta-barrel domain-containing protein n=1 Tax=Aggregatibacter segnis TaxID=739 RepID=UPI00288A5078|nr:autotransporter outer membrane beta-barrel domain-containing protein [Aggregatibacter segnis]